MNTFLHRAVAASRTATTGSGRLFHSSTRACVRIGDELPSVKLVENSPGNLVDVREEIAKKGMGRGLIVGVPAAFSKLFFFYLFFTISFSVSLLFQGLVDLIFGWIWSLVGFLCTISFLVF
jgi:hypothetical protein